MNGHFQSFLFENSSWLFSVLGPDTFTFLDRTLSVILNEISGRTLSVFGPDTFTTFGPDTFVFWTGHFSDRTLLVQVRPDTFTQDRTLSHRWTGHFTTLGPDTFTQDRTLSLTPNEIIEFSL